MTEVLLSTALLTAIVLVLTAAVMAARAVLAPSRTVEILVNGTTAYQGHTGDKLLPILRGGGLPIPSACAGAGTCGLCRVRIPEGVTAPLPTELARLSRTEVREGVRLACQTVVRAPLKVTVPDEFLSAETLTCTVVSNTMLAPLIKEVVLALPKGTGFDPRPGAFVQITAPPYTLAFAQIEVDPAHEEIWRRLGWRALQVDSDAPVTRAYSLANTPADEGRVVLTIRLAVPPPGGDDIPPGLVSSYLFGLTPGDSVEVAGPYGDFGAMQTDREMVFIGGGVGMAPLRSIVHDQLDRLGTTRRMSYWYGARGEADAFYVEEFRDLADRHSNFSFHLALSDPDPDRPTDAATGFIHEVAYRTYLSDHPAPEDCEYYLCGPPLMIHAVRAMLDSIGVEDEMIHFDDFGG
ncbi:MAG: NADH:ubiquinone reductase (Na(+)-transporting) subunit F [Rhodobacter sp.]|nr:NADH:ubiquinone reductase (Na(+)-transporting) subunit F [Rhodobacter sp.]